MIGRAHHVVIDCRDPGLLAEFYAELIGLPVTFRSEDFAVVSASTTTSGFAFQRAPDHQPPRWPDPSRPQQMHLDVMVDDLTVAAEHVYADPAGHPFCLIPRPSWAAPIGPA